MASDESFVEFVVEQMQDAGRISFRKMFGEYGIYCNDKIVALVCDNRLFVKPTEAGRRFIGEVVEAQAYPGARPSFLIEEQIEGREWLCQLIRVTEEELPKPKKKRQG